MRTIAVDGHSERWLRKGFPWVYPAEIPGPKPRPGELVALASRGGEDLGVGFGDDGWIAVRRWRDDRGPVDADLVAGRLAAAQALRRAVVGPDTNAYRLIHGEGDACPGVRVDRWGDVASIVLDTPSVAAVVPHLCDLLAADGVVGIVQGVRPDPRDTGRKVEGATVLWGDVAEEVEVREHGLRFGIRPLDAPDVGLYTDLRDLRAWLAPRWAGRRVLNTFAFTGAFTVAALAGGASGTVTVDLSRASLTRARANLARNGLPEDGSTFIDADVFRTLDALRRSGEGFDVIVLDPPSFSRSDVGVWSAQRDWPRLTAAAARVARPGAWIVAVSNQGELSPHPWHGMLADGVARAGRTGSTVMVGGQSGDVPARLTFPEGRYLKTAVLALD